MKNALIAILVILTLIGLFAAGFYAFAMYSLNAITESMNSMHTKQIVAENIQIKNEWTEIIPEKPLEPTKRIQQILLSIENFADDYEDDYPILKLKDGTIINPEIEVVDEIGKTHTLKYSSIHNGLVAFSPPKIFSLKIIRIKSDKPFLCEKIIWHDYDVK